VSFFVRFPSGTTAVFLFAPLLAGFFVLLALALPRLAVLTTLLTWLVTLATLLLTRILTAVVVLRITLLIVAHFGSPVATGRRRSKPASGIPRSPMQEPLDRGRGRNLAVTSEVHDASTMQ
jgi:hypothetical protein